MRKQPRARNGQFKKAISTVPLSATAPQHLVTPRQHEGLANQDSYDGWQKYLDLKEHQFKGRVPNPPAGLYKEFANSEIPDPDGCRWCGERARDHATSFSSILRRLHKWERPTETQRKERMVARRKKRIDQ